MAAKGLSGSLSTLVSDLVEVYSNNKNTAEMCAKGVATAVHTWAVEAVPMTTHTGVNGEGGLDIVTPGKGLQSARPKFVADLTKLYSNNKNTAKDLAKGLADATLAFYTSAKVMTLLTIIGDPATAYTATGVGGLDMPTAGKGMGAALPAYISALTKVFSKNKNQSAECAKGVADATFDFFSAVKVDTNDAGSAGSGTSLSGSVS